VSDNRDSSDQITESRKQKVPGGCPAPEVELGIGLVVVVVVVVVMMFVIVVVPIMFGAPAVSIFVPPAMAVLPTPGARFRKFMAIFRGLGTIPAVMLGGFVKFMVRPDDALLAVVVSAHRCRAREEQRSA
jgi:hypothetical protein